MGKLNWSIGPLIAAAAIVCINDPSRAVERSTPNLPGATGGIPLGASLPEGVYLSQFQLHWDSRPVNGQGQVLPTSFHFDESATLLFISTGYTFLGAKYSGFVAQSFERSQYNYGVGELNGIGPYNTLLAPAILSWDLSHGFYASTSIEFYLPDTPQHTTVLTTGNGFFTAAPTFAISYLNNGINLTANLEVDLNKTNPTTNYHTGDGFDLDYTATKSFGNTTLGVVGYYSAQFQNDSLNGVTIAAGPANSRGNKQQQLTVGPYVAYDFGKFSVAAWYDRAIYTRNGSAASIIYAKVSVPLGDLFNFGAKPTDKPTFTSLPDRTERFRN